MIIVEGADNVGKSTLIKQLIELDPQLRVLHRDRFNPQKEETIATSYLRALLPKDGDRVAHSYGLADRFLASECIYGDLFRKGCRMNAAEHRAIRNMLNAYQAMVIFCDPPDDVIMSTWTKREQLYDNPLQIAHAYRDRMHMIFPKTSVFRYDWTADGASDQRAAFVHLHRNVVKITSRHLSWWSSVPYGAGILHAPGLILIGESPSPQAKVQVPFSEGGAAVYLADTLTQVEGMLDPRDRWRASQYYITNAMKDHVTEEIFDGRSDAVLLREELNFLIHDETVVIALGREAEKMYRAVEGRLHRQPRRFAALRHPQFVRRFAHHEQADYAREFVAVLKGE